VRGSGKLYKHRYQLQRFGTGFMHLALNHKTPIVPVGIVGCEETMPAVANLAPIARLLGIPYLPLVPSLLPLPARVYLNFGKPMHFEPAANEAEVVQRVEEVKAELRGLIDLGLAERTRIF
jgi:1-acyl-sn-glycerol-3-phosphate acyltransferase